MISNHLPLTRFWVQRAMLQFHKNYELRLRDEGIQQEELKYLFRQKRFPQTISAMRFGMVKEGGKIGLPRD